MKKILSLSVLFLLMMGGFFTSKNVSASEGGLPYLVEPILPANQDKGIEHYISVSPKDNSLKQEFEFLVTNKTNKKQTINAKMLNAYTSTNGGIQYTAEETEHNVIIDEKYEMRNYVQVPKKIELDGGESKIVRLKVNMPKMEGTILGAVAFQGEGEIEESNNKGVSFEIKNEINTVYGIAVNFPTTKNYSFKIGKPFLEPMPSYYAVRLPITMDSPLLLKDVQIDYEVEFKGEKLFFSKEKIDFAPMTKTNFSIPFDYEEIEQNKPYILKGTLTYKDKDGVEQTMDFKSQFEYTVKKDKNDNKITKVLKAPIEKGGFPYWILLLFPVIGIVVYMKKKTKYFVLLTDEQPSLIIDKESPNFDKLQPKNKTANDHNYKFVHYYTKKQSEQNGEYYYAYHKTINNKNDRV